MKAIVNMLLEFSELGGDSSSGGENKKDTIKHKAKKGEFEVTKDGFRIHAEDFFPGDSTEIHISKNAETQKSEVLLSYSGFVSEVSFFFSVGVECQFIILSMLGDTAMGTAKALEIKNDLSSAGGTIEVLFISGMKGFYSQKCRFILSVSPMDKPIFS